MGDAKRVLQHLGVYEENYEKTWDLSDRRYSNRGAFIEKETPTKKALDTMRSVIQNLRKGRFNCEERIPFIPILSTPPSKILNLPQLWRIRISSWKTNS